MHTPYPPENLPQRENGKLPAFAWPGGYPIIYFAADNGVLCPVCANAYTPERDNAEQLEPIAFSIHYEGADEICENCNAVIPSAYGDPDAKNEVTE